MLNRKTSAGLLVATVIALFLTVPAAQASTSSAAPAPSKVTFVKGTLTLIGTNGNNSFVITCSGGKVLINNKTPSIGQTMCTKVKKISISAEHGDDVLNLTSVDAVGFPNLVSTTLDAGAGDDVLNGSALPDKLIGGEGNDTLVGNSGQDSIDGSKGINDQASVAGQLVSFTANSVNTDGVIDQFKNVEEYGVGGLNGVSNTINGVGSPVPLAIQGGNMADTLTGSPFDDSLVGNSGVDTMNGGNGNDTFTGWAGDDAIDGGIGTDQVNQYLFAGPATLTDSQLADPADTQTGTDSLTSIERAFLLLNSGTGTTINAATFTGSTELVGGDGADIITGGTGNDEVVGAGGNNTLSGGSGGTDQIDGYGASVTLSDSTLVMGTGTSTLVGFDKALLNGLSTADTIDGSAFSGPQNITGGAGSDTLTGGSNDDHISGEAGNDHLIGNNGNDTLNGGTGTDTCTGGAGTNTLKACE